FLVCVLAVIPIISSVSTDEQQIGIDLNSDLSEPETLNNNFLITSSKPINNLIRGK
ncbi:MAG: hypothetical protein UZ02_AOB001001104, partial [Nitrosomonas europaea]